MKSIRYPIWMLCIAFLLATPFVHSASTESGDDLALNPSASQSKVLQNVFSHLQRFHYRKLTVDDRLSEQLLDQYLDYLDPSRIFLLASDVEEFEAFRHLLDDALKDGDLDPAYTIFRRFQERRVERTEYLVDSVENRLDLMDFSLDERMELDRAGEPWVTSREAWDELWRKYFKNDVIVLKLLDRSDEKIKETLGRRYKNRLMRMKQVNDEDVFRTYINVFTQNYDPHTEYFPPRRAENFDITMSLSYEGIGALLGGEGEYITISRIIPGGPAEADGRLKAGDRIVGVAQEMDGEMVDIIGWRVDEAVELIRGPKETVLRLSILPANLPDSGSTHIIDLTRGQVKLEEQAARRKTVKVDRDGTEFNVGVIELPAFYIDFEAARRGDPDYKSSTRDVARLIKELKAEKVDGLVVDLRNNAGGSLIEAVELTSLFVEGGYVVQIRDAKKDIQVMPSLEDDTLYDGPLVVLVNRLSASASEIFAAAIQDRGRGVVVGGRTFGKGTVQRLVPLGDGQLKMTKAKFYRINGGSTQSRGVEPDIPFPATYNNDEIGESALDDALPWDQISAVPFSQDPLVKERLPDLRSLHGERASKDPDFVRTTEQLAFFQKARQQTLVSLNREVRKKEREDLEAELLTIENRRRLALGLDPVETLEELTEAEEDTDDDVDSFAREAAKILIDFVHYTRG